ncbi:transcription elongation factor GreA [Spiroplasma endosymbiont of 'Nebria riversi']|uniref:transcription elongation factor GreA n=1 Tax=Spiroplasma endosymbiont of 'Nebria riversi' TaxID=2792084 RepID=UPI001C04FB4A|nr:transcription elongation factor GreA [Spiroplasma endosymbiont of 'Nebria riversi']
MEDNNNNNEILLTKEGKEELNQELNELINIIRPQVIKELVEARNQGDLSENAEYESARNRQAEVEGRIKEIEDTLARAKVIATDRQGTKTIRIGSIVTILNLETNDKSTFKIVGTVEADPFENKISNETPLVKAIFDHSVNDIVEIKGKETKYKVKILEIGK